MPDDLNRLQGGWKVTSLEVDGMALPSAALTGARILIDGDNFTSITMGATYAGTMQVDASKNPKTFSMKFTDGPEKGNTNHGIYELVGDNWKICLTMTGGPAPASFTTTPGAGQAMETLVREPLG